MNVSVGAMHFRCKPDSYNKPIKPKATRQHELMKSARIIKQILTKQLREHAIQVAV